MESSNGSTRGTNFPTGLRTSATVSRDQTALYSRLIFLEMIRCLFTIRIFVGCCLWSKCFYLYFALHPSISLCTSSKLLKHLTTYQPQIYLTIHIVKKIKDIEYCLAEHLQKCQNLNVRILKNLLFFSFRSSKSSNILCILCI